MKIELTKDELDYCINQALMRNSGKKTQDSRSGWSSRDRHVFGYLGEYILSKLGFNMDFEIYGTKGDNGRPDGTYTINKVEYPVHCKTVIKAQKVWLPKPYVDEAPDNTIVGVLEIQEDTAKYIKEYISLQEFEKSKFYKNNVSVSVKGFILNSEVKERGEEVKTFFYKSKNPKDICYTIAFSELKKEVGELINE